LNDSVTRRVFANTRSDRRNLFYSRFSACHPGATAFACQKVFLYFGILSRAEATKSVQLEVAGRDVVQVLLGFYRLCDSDFNLMIWALVELDADTYEERSEGIFGRHIHAAKSQISHQRFGPVPRFISGPAVLDVIGGAERRLSGWSAV
jgi:hypothetical protein